MSNSILANDVQVMILETLFSHFKSLEHIIKEL